MKKTVPPAPARDDHQVRRDVARALEATGRFGANCVDIRAAGGVIQLRGRVPSYYHKQMAQAAALTVLGTCQLVNDIEVV